MSSNADILLNRLLERSELDLRRATDRQLLKLAAERDDDACYEFVARYGKRLLSVVEKSHGDLQLSEDIVQDALFRAIEKHKQLRDDGAVFPWLARIALRRAADYRRKIRRESLVDMLGFGESRAAESSLGEWKLDEDRERSQVREALGRLKAYHRELLVLRYYAQLSVEELAQVFKKNNALIRKDLERARAQLERRLPRGFGGKP
ncbi:MAG: RNA polymerase sigma factor [Myxococcota bacterium]